MRPYLVVLAHEEPKRFPTENERIRTAVSAIILAQVAFHQVDGKCLLLGQQTFPRGVDLQVLSFHDRVKRADQGPKNKCLWEPGSRV